MHNLSEGRLSLSTGKCEKRYGNGGEEK